MSTKRASIAQVMMLIALVAVNLFTFRSMPSETRSYPTVWVILGSIDLVVYWKLIGKRTLRAFHYTFLIVFFIGFIVMANLVATERFLPLRLLVRGYHNLSWANPGRSLPFFFIVPELWSVCLLSFALAIGMGLAAESLERRQNWEIAAFFRGALAGYAIATFLMIIEDRLWGSGLYPPIRIIGKTVVLGICLIAGGWIGLSRPKSRTTAYGEPRA